MLTVRLSLTEGRVTSPSFDPPGLPEGACLQGEYAWAGTCIVPFGPFVEFDLRLIVNESGLFDIYYTLDTCPIGTQFCTTTGSMPSRDEAPISEYVAHSTVLKVFGTTPTRSMMPDGLSDNKILAFFPGDNKITYVLDEIVLADLKLNLPLIASGKHVGITANRQTSTLPRYLKAKAFARENGKKNSFPVSTTFELSPQASTPEINLHEAELWVLGWCNATHSSIPNARVGDKYIRKGSCADIQHTNDSSVCSGAGAVPCRLQSAEAFCTAGSLSHTIADKGMYDGVLVRASGTSTLSQPFSIGDSRIFVTSVAALGFTNNGVLVHPRQLWTMCQGQTGCRGGRFTVYSVRVSDESLQVQYDHDFIYATGTMVSLNDTCTASLVHETLIIPMQTTTLGARIYYNIPGSEPRINSTVLGPSNSLAIRVESDTSYRAVAGGDKLMNSPFLHLDVNRPCGNGVINGGEQCDDGNGVDGDLCSSECMFERECTDAVWRDVLHSNIGILYTDRGLNHTKPDALKVSQSPSLNGTGLTSDCAGYVLVSHLQQITTGGTRKISKLTSQGRMSDSGCTVAIGNELLFAGNYLFSVFNDQEGFVAGSEDIFMYDVDTEVFAANKYSFGYPKNAMGCQAIGTQAWFGGGIRVNAQKNAFQMVDDIDQLDIVLPTEERPVSTHRWQYAKYKLSRGRMYVKSAQAAGLVAFGGGLDFVTGDILANFDVLDPVGKVVNTSYLPTARYFHAMVGVGHLILVAGGMSSFGNLRDIDIYDTRYRNFTSLVGTRGLSFARSLLTAAATDTKAYFAGGFGEGGVRAEVDMFDLDTMSMTVMRPLTEPRHSLIGAQSLGNILFGGGRRRDGAEPLGSNKVDIYEFQDGNHSVKELSEPRYFHFGGSVNDFAVFGLGIRTDPGFQDLSKWLTVDKPQSVDIFEMAPLTIKVRANITTPRDSKMVTMPFYDKSTRLNLAVPLNTISSYDKHDVWRMTCAPGFRKSLYQTPPLTNVYTAFLCVCTNVTNFFNKPSLFPSDQAVSAHAMRLATDTLRG